MRRCIPLVVILAFFISSCSKSDFAVKSDGERIAFLSKYGIIIDTGRLYYNSSSIIPEIFDTTWDIRSILSKDTIDISLDKYKGKQCMIYTYPVSKLPFDIKKEPSTETRAAVICYKDNIICSYIEFISELRTLPPMSLKGQSLIDLTGVKWNTWKDRIDTDGDKRLVIWRYYEALRSGNYEGAYVLIYDKENIKKADFINAAKETTLLFIDFLEMNQYKEPTQNESFFVVKAKVSDGKGKFKSKVYEITFDLKQDPKEKDYGGWKIYKTKIK